MKQSSSVTLERSFSASSIPNTIKIANIFKDLILEKGKSRLKNTPFDDFVFSILAPEFNKDILEFHVHNGPSLSDSLEQHQIEHFDHDMAKKLVKYLSKIIK